MIDRSFIEKIGRESEEFYRLYQEITTLEQAENELPKVIACGLYNQGKSSLLNIITDHIDKEYFKTSAARETVEVKSFTSNDVIYIDTPGFDGKKDDDNEAWKGLIDANVVLFVHSLKEREFDIQERALLKNLSDKRPSLSNELLVVFTHGENSPDRDKIVEHLKKQLNTILGFSYKHFVLSSSTYKKGKLENKNALVNISGVLILQEAIKKQLSTIDIIADKNKQLSSLKQKITEEISDIINKRKEKINALTSEQENNISRLRNDLLSMQNNIVERIANFNKI